MTQKTRPASSGQSDGWLDKNKKELAQTSLAIVCAAFILLIPALLNGFPFIFPDSGDYIFFTPRLYRSPFYGLFIFFFHLNRWIWGPIIAQALIVSHLLWLLLKLYRLQKIEAKLIFLSVLLTLFSSLPWFVGYIMADIFTPVMFLAMYVIAFHYAELSGRLKIYLALLACVATAAHPSNLTLNLGMFYLFILLLFWVGLKRREILNRLGVLFIPIALTALATFLFNSLIFGLPTLAPTGSIIFMSNLIEYGPAKKYLDHACPAAGYKICIFHGKLAKVADSIMWDRESVEKMGGYKNMRMEARIIVEETIREYPLDVAAMIVRNFGAGLITHEPAAEIASKFQVPWVIDNLMKKFGPHAVENYLDSAEMRDTIPHALIAKIDSIVAPLSFLALLVLGLFVARRKDRQHAILAVAMMAAVLGNAFLCTAVSGVYDRYQARVSWLLPMAVFVIASSLMTKQRTKRKTDLMG